MAKSWLYKYGDDAILVVNKGFRGSELYINNQLTDTCTGVSIKDCLVATLKNGELITATLQGMTTMECTLLINKVPQNPVEVK